MLKFTLTAALVLAASATPVGGVEPVFWRTKVFFIPYQPAPQQAASIEKVQLLVARDGLGEWAVLQEAQPNVRGFSYHAPADGEYAFALRTVDRKGNVTPMIIAQPQLRVVVDTAVPKLQLNTTPDATGRILIRYDASDVQLKPETLHLEAQTDGSTWQRIAPGPPEGSRPERVNGQVAWKPPPNAGTIRVRGAIEDRAGNQAFATADVPLIGPLLTPPGSFSSATSSSPLTAPSLAPAAQQTASTAPPLTSARTPLEWPALADRKSAGATAPLDNPFSSVGPSPVTDQPFGRQDRTPATLVADGRQSMHDASTPETGKNPFDPPPLFGGPSQSLLGNANTPSNTPARDFSLGWTAPSAGDQTNAGIRWVNTTTFDVDYDLQSVGPWGVSKVELWATRNGGQEWVNFGADPDNRGPMRITVPTAGVYGFRLVVCGANGTAAPTPTAGDKPELEIGVDLQEPQAELKPAEIGQGNLADHLLIHWAASDENLDPRPAALFFSTEAEGPWTTIATDLDNNGQYAWRLLRQIPEKLYLRLEVRDKAGNVAVRQSPAPVVLSLPQPTGRLRNVRPVVEDPTRYRTAAGPMIHSAPAQ